MIAVMQQGAVRRDFEPIACRMPTIQESGGKQS